ncbi:unnamed protein product, partial [Ectocarpus sp. 12 AP-2014]
MPSSCPICAVSSAAAELAPACPLAVDLEDEERMEFLTSHVAPGDVDARDEMVEFWSRVIAHAFEKAACLSLDSKVLATSPLDWGGVVAPGLDLAMSHMVSSGELLERSEIVEAETGLARRLVMAPITYMAGMVGLGRGGGGGQYANRNVLEDLAEQVVGYCQHLPPDERTVYLLAAGHSEATSRPVAQHASPWNFEQLCRAAAAAAEAAATTTATRVASGRGPPTPEKSLAAAPRMLARISNDDVALFAKYLVRTKRAVTEGGLLKVLSRGGGSRVAAAGATVSETEKDLLRLRCTAVASLEASASDLGLRIQRVQQDALMENRRGQKRAALVHLRRMKQYQAARDNRLSSLLTLEKALDQVKQLRLDKQVLEAHEAATSALKACRETQGLTVERVEDTLD